VFGRSGDRTRCLVDIDDAILIHHDHDHDRDHDIAGLTTKPGVEHNVSWLELARRELSPNPRRTPAVKALSKCR
jgi:hypothetical protein